MINTKNIFGYQFEKVEKCGNATLLHMINKTGYGLLTYRNILPGIELTYDHIHMESFWKKLEKLKKEVIQFNHCLKGKFVFHMENGRRYCMNAGDICIYDASFGNVAESSIPGKHYRGLSVSIQPQKSEGFIRTLNMETDVDFTLFKERIKKEGGPVLLPASAVPARLIDELYFIENSERNSLYVLKVAELLVYLCDFLKKREGSSYKYSQDMLKAVRKIHDKILAQPMQKMTAQELSREFLIPRTGFAQCFKELYGMPPAAFMRYVKMRTVAEEMLQHPEMSIREAASFAGYDNQSKFARAFKEQWGVTPLSYKKMNLEKHKQTEQKLKKTE